MRRERLRPMPTEEEKARAKLKAESMDPLVWAMKSVDAAFPDSRGRADEVFDLEDEYDEVDEMDEPAVVNPAMGPALNPALTSPAAGMSPAAVMAAAQAAGVRVASPAARTAARPANVAARPANVAAQAAAQVRVANPEIQAEGKVAVPADDGVLTMEVTPMRQDVSEVSPEEVRANRAGDMDAEPEKKSFFKSLRKKKAAKEVGGQAERASNKQAGEAWNKNVEQMAEKKATERGLKGEKKSAEPGAEGPKKGSLITKVKDFDSSQKKMMVAVGVMSLATVAGVVFGVVSMVRQGETTKELTEQIAEAQNNAKLVAQADAVDGDYINLKDWGLRIKIVTGLSYVSYNYASDGYSELMLWGAKKDTSANYSPEFVNQSKNASSMGTVVRVPRYERAAAGRLIWYDDYYNYYYQGPSGVPNVSEDEMNWWVESYLLIKEMLTNADNYEKYDQNTIGQS